MQDINLIILDKKVGSEIELPKYATEGSAGMDLSACIDKPIKLGPNEVQLIGTGIAIHIKNPSIAATLLPRSGLGHKKGIVLGNLVGLIDSDYQGELKISCWNRSTEPFTVNPGDRICQIAFLPIVKVSFNVVSDFDESERAENGFGSSGIN